jgi:archaellum component FlaC
MEEILKQILGKLNDMEQRFEQRFNEVDKRFDEVDKRFDEVDKRFDRIETELEDVKRVVRMSAEDILENQVEEVARHNLHADKIHTLEATTFRIDKSVLELKRRVDRIEKANEQ